MELFNKYFEAKTELLRFFNCDTLFNNAHSIYRNDLCYWKILEDIVYISYNLDNVRNIRLDYCDKYFAFDKIWIYPSKEYTLLHLKTGNSGVFEIYLNKTRMYD
jgi:hypothetical protein